MNSDNKEIIEDHENNPREWSLFVPGASGLIKIENIQGTAKQARERVKWLIKPTDIRPIWQSMWDNNDS